MYFALPAKSQECIFNEPILFMNDFFLSDTVKTAYTIANNWNLFYDDFANQDGSYFELTKYDNGYSTGYNFIENGRQKSTVRYNYLMCQEVEAFGVNFLVLKINDEIRFYEVLHSEESGDSFLYKLIQR